MPKEIINGIEMFYEIDGDGGNTVVLLNGIMMSTVDWYGFVPAFTRDYRLLRIDFRNQGRSQYVDEDFEIDIHVEDLKLLLEKLNIKKLHVVGTSYGGEVAMLFALKYHEQVQSLVLSNTSARVTRHMSAVKDCWIAAAESYDGETFYKVLLPFLYSPEFYEKNWDWLKRREKAFKKVLTKSWFDAFIKLAASTTGYDIQQKLHSVKVPTLCIASDRDIVTPFSEMEIINAGIIGSELTVMNGSGHAACFEQKDKFNSLVLDFIRRHS